MQLRPLHDGVIVRLEERPEEDRRGNLVIPRGSSAAERVFTGHVVRLGTGKRQWSDRLEREVTLSFDVKVGDRVAFFRENLEHQQGKQVTKIVQELEEGHIYLEESDILWVWE